ncbi:hypothetical protein O181_027634 [Austropuccinia psidii MF-1]|uniref:Uncharacterized protein n=1 Tax=Austropuccinia psidii MF-1 TaxID=1389203 RepID=A0A9Q3CMD5_9BASI|nr:hypothetical protein [Austropuccinia psidii MF-1]
MINMKLKKFKVELEHAIKLRCIEQCSTEDYINPKEDIITRTRIGKTWTRNPMESKTVPNTSKEDRRHFLKLHKCESTSNLASTCSQRTKINKVQVIEED